MKAKGHLQTFNHFNFAVLDASLFRKSWEKAFDFQVPEMTEQGEMSEEAKTAMMKLFAQMKPMTYRGGSVPAPKSFGVDPGSCPPIYQPESRMIEAKPAGSLPTVTAAYEREGNCIQYFGIVEGANRDPFLKSLREDYGCEVLEEMFYAPLPGDFCFVETEPVLGFNLCVKADGALNGRVEVILQDTTECTVVTEDLDKAVENYTDIFDIQRPEIRTIRQTILFRGKPREAEFRVARIDEAPFTLYLAEDPLSGPFAEYSQKNGHGIHHIAFDMGETCEAFRARMETELSIPVLAEYEMDGMHYLLFDSQEKMGGLIAVRRPV